MGSYSIDRIDGLAIALAVLRNLPNDTNEAGRTTDPDFIRSVVGQAPGPVDPTGGQFGESFPADTDKAGVDCHSGRETGQ